jgi:hypothetical protein
LVDLAPFAVPIAEIAVALGTLSLAYLAYKTLKENQKQLSLLSSQTTIFRSQLDPYLVVKSLKFEGNQVRINIENLGKGHATWLGIEGSFYLVEPRLYADRGIDNPITESQAKERQQRSLTVWGRYVASINTTPLSYGDRSNVTPTSIVSFLVNKDIGDALLRVGEAQEFVLEPFFGFVTDNKFELSGYQALRFSELREFLDRNGVRYVALDFHVVCKDIVDNDGPSERLCRFVMDLRKHQTLEEAYREDRDFGFTPVSVREMTRKEGFFSSSDYRGLKAMRNVSEPWKKNEP